MGEGAAYVCVERVPAARERGANVLCRILGYSTAFEPPESEALLVHGSSDAIRRAVLGALRDAGLGRVDYYPFSLGIATLYVGVK